MSTSSGTWVQLRHIVTPARPHMSPFGEASKAVAQVASPTSTNSSTSWTRSLKVELSDEAKRQAREANAWWRKNRDLDPVLNDRVAAVSGRPALFFGIGLELRPNLRC